MSAGSAVERTALVHSHRPLLVAAFFALVVHAARTGRDGDSIRSTALPTRILTPTVNPRYRDALAFQRLFDETVKLFAALLL